MSTQQANRTNLFSKWMSKRRQEQKRSPRKSVVGNSLEALEPRQMLAANPVISEFMAFNSSGLQDADGHFSDWIEIHNDGDAAIDLIGWHLTDDPALPTKWTFPSINLGIDERLVVFASSKGLPDGNGALHTNFSLDVDGEYLALIRDDGTTAATEFSPKYPEQFADISYGNSTDFANITTPLIDGDSPVKAFVPSGELVDDWTGGDEPYDELGWTAGTFGVGFDDNELPLINETVSALSSPNGLAGNQNFGGSLGMDFVVNEETTVTSLGVFDASSDGLANDIVAQLWSRNENGTPGDPSNDTGSAILATETFTNADPGTLEGGNRFKTLAAPLVLSPGAYTIVAYGYSAAEMLHNSGGGANIPTINNGGGQITLEGTARYGTAGAFPGTPDGGPANRYHAGTFQFNTTINPNLISITNPSFESQPLADTGFTTTAPTGWTRLGGTSNGGAFNPTSAAYDGADDDPAPDPDSIVPDGTNIAYLDVQAGNGIFQELSAVLQPNVEYSLSAWFGHRKEFPVNPQHTMRLVAGNTVIAESTGTVGLGQWIQDTAVGSVDSDNPDLGQNLRIEIENTGGSQVNFDLVELTTESGFDLDLKDNMHNVNSGAYIRAPFNISAEQLSDLDQLEMDITYDDGFVAYLNGTEIARRNAPGLVNDPVAFNAVATLEANTSETIDLTAFSNLLIASENILAIHGLNLLSSDGDFLIDVKLNGNEQKFITEYFPTPSPGSANGDGITFPGVVINEIHYDPENKSTAGEFIELYNPSDEVIDISGWYFSDGIDYTFDPGTMIGAGEYLVVAQDQFGYGLLFGAGQNGPIAIENESFETQAALMPNVNDFLNASLAPITDWTDQFPAGAGAGLLNSGDAPDGDIVMFLNSGGGGYVVQNLEFANGQPVTAQPGDQITVNFLARHSLGTASSVRVGIRGPVNAAVEAAHPGTIIPVPASAGYTALQATFTILDSTALGALEGQGINLVFDSSAAGQVWIDSVSATITSGVTQTFGTPEGYYTGQLSNNGERVRLNNNLDQVVDQVDYNVGFPWPVQANGDGSSMELQNPSLDNDLGGSWRSSIGSPTPGLENSVSVVNAGPQIRQVSHGPNSPTSGQDVVVTAKATGTHGVAEVKLQYQLVDPGSYIRSTDAAFQTTWTDIVMVDDGTGDDAVAGDHVYTATIPGAEQVHRRLVRYRIVAEDNLQESVIAPYDDDPQPNFAYFVYDGIPDWTGADQPGVTAPVTYDSATLTSIPSYQLISQQTDVEASQFGNGNENTWYEGALVYDNVVYDHIRYRVRGQNSTRRVGKNKWKLDFNRSHYFQGRDNFGNLYDTEVAQLNFGSLSAPWAPVNLGMAGLDEAVAFRLWDKAGVPSSNTNAFQLRVIDNVNETDPGGDQYESDLWGLYLAIEEPGGKFLDEHNLPDGNLFRMQLGGASRQLNQGPGEPGDKSDLNAFTSASTGYNKTGPIQDVQWWKDNIDIEAYFSYRAVMEAVNHNDQRDQENSVYYHNPETDKWTIIPWDVDLLYERFDRWGPNGSQNASPLEQFRKMLEHPELNIMFQARARELQDLLLNEDQGWQLVDEYANLVEPMAAVDRAMWDYNPRTNTAPAVGWHHGSFYQQTASSPGGGIGIQRTIDSPDFAGMRQWVKDFISPNGFGDEDDSNQLSGLATRGGKKLLDMHQDPQIPNTPTISSTSGPNFAINEIVLDSTNFAGLWNFAAMEWRIGEVTDASAPSYDANAPIIYEIDTIWESGELDSFGSSISVPSDVLESGHSYRARVRMQDDTGRWSHWSDPLEFITSDATPTDVSQYLRVTEIMFNPTDQTAAEFTAAGVEYDNDQYEFVELMNIGPTSLDLTGTTFNDGIAFTFGAETLDPNERIVVVRNQAAFTNRYGNDPQVHIAAGQYGDLLDPLNDSALANSGDDLAIIDATGGPVQSFRYDDKTSEGWYDETDGDGKSLVLIDPTDALSTWDLPESWRPSNADGGSPGKEDALVGDINGDNQVGLADLLLLKKSFNDSQGGGPPLPADLSGDGIVDTVDLGLLLENYGASLPVSSAPPAQAASALTVEIPQAAESAKPKVKTRPATLRTANAIFVDRHDHTTVPVKVKSSSRQAVSRNAEAVDIALADNLNIDFIRAKRSKIRSSRNSSARQMKHEENTNLEI